MKFSKRLTALLLALLLCVSLLAGCQKKDDEQQNNTDDQQQEEVTLDVKYEDNAVPVRDPAYDSDVMGTGAVGANGAAASASELASQIAMEVLQKGGNAVDAAVAMIYAVGMLEPAASGIGGAGHMLVYLAETKEYVVIEYMTQAGEKAIPGSINTYNQEIPVDTITNPQPA